MLEKVKSISNPLTIIAIFAALAEINATVSIGLVDKDLQTTFIWFVILFPTLLVCLFFLTLNFNTKVIYAPSDYKDDQSFHKMLIGETKPDIEINRDKDIIRKTLDELGINDKTLNQSSISVSDNISLQFAIRHNMEKEVRRLAVKYLDADKIQRPLMMLLPRLVENGILNHTQHKAIRNIYSITTPAIHGDDEKLTNSEIEFLKQVAPGLIDELIKMNN